MDYYAMSEVLEVLGDHADCLLAVHDIAERSGRNTKEVWLVLQTLQERGWVVASGNKMNYGIRGEGERHAGSNPAQLLALDIANHLLQTKAKAVDLGDLPPQFKDTGDLLTLALGELDAAESVRLHRSRKGILSFEVLPGLCIYKYGEGRPLRLTAVSVAGDVVAGDKNTAAAGGIVATHGSTVMIKSESDLRHAVAQVADEIEQRDEQGAEAARKLRKALACQNKFDAAKLIDGAVAVESSVRDRLAALVSSVAVGVASSAIYQALTMVLG